ncbi:LysM domain-containing protein [Lachnospiraceae bacterium 29-84]
MAKIIPIPIGPIFNGGPCRGLVHVIEKGDTLYQLGKRYHVSVGQLLFANPFVNVYNLQIGDELCIPISPQPRNQEQDLDMPERMPWEQNPDHMEGYMPGEQPEDMLETIPFHEESESGMTDGM